MWVPVPSPSSAPGSSNILCCWAKYCAYFSPSVSMTMLCSIIAMVIHWQARRCSQLLFMRTLRPRRHCHQPFKAPMQCSDRIQRCATAESKIELFRWKLAGFLWTGIVWAVKVYAESVQANSLPLNIHSGQCPATVCINAEASCAEPVIPWEKSMMHRFDGTLPIWEVYDQSEQKCQEWGALPAHSDHNLTYGYNMHLYSSLASYREWWLFHHTWSIPLAIL